MSRLLIFLGALLQIVALVFLILATLSAPVTRTFTLATDGDITYGVLGYCEALKGCSKATAAYTPSTLSSSTNWVFDPSPRDTLAKMLIVTPIAAGLTLFALVYSVIPTTKGMAGFTVGVALQVLASIATLFSMLVVVLLFYPHLTWGGWILIGCAVLNLVALALYVCGVPKITDDTDDDYDEAGIPFGKTEPDHYFSSIPNTSFQTPHAPYLQLELKAEYEVTSTIPSSTRDHDAFESYQGYTGEEPAENATYNNPYTTAAVQTRLNDFSTSQEQPFLPQEQPQPPQKQPYPLSLMEKPTLRAYTAVSQEPNAPLRANASMAPFGTEPRYPITRLKVPTNGAYTPVALYDMTGLNEYDFTSGLEEKRLPVRSQSTDSNFTSISQRGINPQYYTKAPQPSPPGLSYPSSLVYQPNTYQQPHQQYPTQTYQGSYEASSPNPLPMAPPRSNKPTITDVVLENNPDFNIGGRAGRKPKLNPYGPRQRAQPPLAASLADGPYR